MTLEEFRTRMRAICAGHAERAKAAQAIFAEAIDQLMPEAKDLISANESVVTSIVRGEIEAMLKEIG